MAGLLLHEWIEKSGGGEKVLQAMRTAFPDAGIRCLWNDDPGPFKGAHAEESWLAKTPMRKSKALALPFMPDTWRRWPGRVDADWALINSHLFAHHARPKSRSAELKRFAYVFSPARYIWEPKLDARGAGLIPRAVAPYFRQLDRKRANEDGTTWAVLSEFVKERVAKAWGVDSTVIYPPVDTSTISKILDWRGELSYAEEAIMASIGSDFILGASRFVLYKGLDEVIRLGETAGIPVVIAGSGPLDSVLQAQAAEARVPVTIVRAPSDRMLYALYQQARAYVFPPIEDFGIMPVEALAVGGKVIVRSVGGAAETIVDGVSGFHVDSFDSSLAVDAINNVESLEANDLKLRSLDFSNDKFIREMRQWVLG